MFLPLILEIVGSHIYLLIQPCFVLINSYSYDLTKIIGPYLLPPCPPGPKFLSQKGQIYFIDQSQNFLIGNSPAAHQSQAFFYWISTLDSPSIAHPKSFCIGSPSSPAVARIFLIGSSIYRGTATFNVGLPLNFFLLFIIYSFIYYLINS